MTERNLLFLTTGFLITCANIKAGEMINPGFYLHGETVSTLTVSAAQSGLVCEDADSETLQVCQPGRKVLVTGQQVCQWSEDTNYPCTRFGYQFNYTGAEQGDVLECVSTFTDNRGNKTENYQHKLEGGEGFIFFDSYKTFAVVDTQIILSETHECNYKDEPLFAVEFIHYYEPQGEISNNMDNTTTMNKRPESSAIHSMATLPNACQTPHLSEAKAEQILTSTVRPHAANEHLPTFWSQCIYRSNTAKPKEVSYVYKFMLHELFDVDTLSPEQLTFNTSFASGGADTAQIIDNLGKKSFVYQSQKRTTILVITGIGGPKDDSGRPTTVIATYYLNDGNMSQTERLKILLPYVRTDVNALNR